MSHFKLLAGYVYSPFWKCLHTCNLMELATDTHLKQTRPTIKLWRNFDQTDKWNFDKGDEQKPLGACRPFTKRVNIRSLEPVGLSQCPNQKQVFQARKNVFLQDEAGAWKANAFTFQVSNNVIRVVFQQVPHCQNQKKTFWGQKSLLSCRTVLSPRHSQQGFFNGGRPSKVWKKTCKVQCFFMLCLPFAGENQDHNQTNGQKLQWCPSRDASPRP